MGRFWALVFAAAFWGTHGHSAERLGRFECVTFAELADVAATVGKLSLNAFEAEETLSRTDFVSAGLQLAFTATNRSEERIYVSADFVLLDDKGFPLIAMNATPPRLYIEDNKAVRLKAFSLAPAGTLADVRQVCMRFYRGANADGRQ